MTELDLAALRREWDRVESWLEVHSPADRATLRGPADGGRLGQLEARLGFPLHPELRALLELHDGSAAPPAAPGVSPAALHAGSFLPLGHRMSGVDDILEAYDVLVGVGEDNVDADLWGEDELAVNLHRCVPFALPNDGGVAFVDHRPGPSYGHVHEMGIGSGDLDGTLWAPGLTEFFRAVADALEADASFQNHRPVLYEDESGQRCLDWETRC